MYPSLKASQAIVLLSLTVVASAMLACSPISKESRENIAPEVTFAMVSENPSAFLDKHLMIGGVVMSVEEESGGSVLELMEWQTNRWGEPLSLDDSGRRLLIRSESKLDPGQYQTGRLVTFSGKVTGSETRLLGENPYRYPVFIPEEIHLWQSPFRYGIHPHPDAQFPYYVGPEDYGRGHPYDPGYYSYPYTPYWYRVK